LTHLFSDSYVLSLSESSLFSYLVAVHPGRFLFTLIQIMTNFLAPETHNLFLIFGLSCFKHFDTSTPFLHSAKSYNFNFSNTFKHNSGRFLATGVTEKLWCITIETFQCVLSITSFLKLYWYFLLFILLNLYSAGVCGLHYGGR